MKKKIFLVCYGAGHINVIEPIVDKLILNKKYNIKLLALTTAYKKVEKKYPREILKRISDYLFLFDENIDEILKNGLKIFNENHSDKNQLLKLETLSYLGLSLTDEINKKGLDFAYTNYNKYGRKSFLPIRTIEEVMKYEKVDLLISTTSPRFEKASFIAAQKMGIKSIQILDLFDDNIYSPNATYTVVMNEIIKNKLLEKGFEKEKVLAFGQPAIEKSVKKVLSLDRITIEKKLNINKGYKTLVYLSQHPLKFDEDFKNHSSVEYSNINPYLFEILDDLKGLYNIFIRLHPNENIDDYKVFFDKYPSVKYANELLDLDETLCICDIAVTPYSTVGIEAISCQKQVFTFKPDFNDHYPISIFKTPPFTYSNSFQELKFKLNKNIENTIELNTPVQFLRLNFIEKIENFISNLWINQS